MGRAPRCGRGVCARMMGIWNGKQRDAKPRARRLPSSVAVPFLPPPLLFFFHHLHGISKTTRKKYSARKKVKNCQISLATLTKSSTSVPFNCCGGFIFCFFLGVFISFYFFFFPKKLSFCCKQTLKNAAADNTRLRLGHSDNGYLCVHCQGNNQKKYNFSSSRGTSNKTVVICCHRMQIPLSHSITVWSTYVPCLHVLLVIPI